MKISQPQRKKKTQLGKQQKNNGEKILQVHKEKEKEVGNNSTNTRISKRRRQGKI